LGASAMVAPPTLVAAAGVATALVLAFKDALHSWLGRLTWQEVRSALVVLAMSVIVLPLLPDRFIDPWSLFNPHELWLMTILIAAASFAGYVAVRMLGERRGLLMGSAAGALVSSTVVTVGLANRVRDREAPPYLAAAAATNANAVMLLRVAILTAAFAPSLALGVGVPLAAAAFLAGIATQVLIRAGGRNATGSLDIKLRSPLDLRAVFRFALVLGAMLIIVRLATQHVGAGAMLPLAALSGLVDVDAVVLAVSKVTGAEASPRLAADAILLAVAADTMLKVLLALAVGGRTMGAAYGASSIASLAVGAFVRIWGG
jgi:uncharacterized membrane protein (DUF4010 family)